MPKAPAQDIDRKTASDMLGVSVRTIDRYIRSGKLNAYQKQGRIWLDKKNVMRFSEDGYVEKRTLVDSSRAAHVASLSLTPKPTPDHGWYRELYEETQRILQEYQQKLQQANYRIGQLESPPPLLTKNFDRRDRDESFSLELLRKEMADRDRELNMLRELVKKEKANRIAFAFITYLLLILQPIFWYLLR